MSIASPVPVLRSSNGTVLQLDEDALLLRRTSEELLIPLRAIRRIRPEGRAVAVELTAPAGTAPAVHRVDDVSEAAVSLFADTVNAALAMRTEEAGTVDGSTLVISRALTESREERRKRRRRIWAFAVGLFHFLLALAVGFHGEWSLALVILLVGPTFGAGSIAFGAMGADHVYRQWYLPRHGITVEAGRAGDARVLGGRFGTYAYTDLHGVSRSVQTRSGAPTVQVAYHPDRPHVAIVREARSSAAGDAALTVALLLFGVAVEGTVITVAVGAFLGMFPGY
ncbi:hypothetical protein GTU99_11410 [Streptomyces sp. PRKS01-65]|nr:hypothetical protein [Streptomyces harenosi]NEY32792.1 hypothetical protein [Streptomyces harenosi]